MFARSESRRRTRNLTASDDTMLKAAGAEITEGAGSRVRIALNGVRAVFHRPHPQKVIPPRHRRPHDRHRRPTHGQAPRRMAHRIAFGVDFEKS